MDDNIKYLNLLGSVKDYVLSDTQKVEIAGLHRFVSVGKHKSILEYEKYNIEDGETPDQVSTKMLGAPEHYWALFLFNDSLKKGLKGWPLSTRQFEGYISQEYGPYSFYSFALTESGYDLNLKRELLEGTKIYSGIDVDGTLSFIDTYSTIKYVDTNLDGMITTKGIDTQMFVGSGIDSVYISGSLTWEQSLLDVGIEPAGDADGKNLFKLDFISELSEYNLEYAIKEYYNILEDNQYEIVTHYDHKSNTQTALESIRIIDYESVLNDQKRSIIIPKADILPELRKLHQNAFKS